MTREEIVNAKIQQQQQKQKKNAEDTQKNWALYLCDDGLLVLSFCC